MSTKGGEFLFKAKYPLPKISRDGRKLTSLEALRAKVFPNFTITRLSQIFMSFGTTLYKPSTREIKLLQSVSGLRGSTENVLIPIADLDDNYSELRKEYHKDWSDKSLDAGAGETKDNAGKDQTKLSGDMPTTHRATKVPQEEQGVENHDPGSDKRSDGARNAVKPRKGRCSLSQLRIDALNDLSLDSVSTSQSVGAKTDSIVAQRVTVSGVAGQKRQAKEPVKCTTGEQRTVLKQGHEEKTQNCVKTAPISEASTRAKANKNDGTKEDIARGKTLLSGKISQGESQQPTKTTQSTNVARRHHTAGTSGGTVTGESTTQHDPPVRHKSGEQLLSHNTQSRLRHRSGKFHPRHIGSISISTGKKIDMVQRSRLYVRARNITSAVPGLTKDTLSKLCPLFGLEWIIEKNPEESEMMKCFGQISPNKPRCPLFVRADSKWRLFALLAYLDKHFCMVDSKGRPTTKKAVEIAKAELAKTPQSIGETTINGHSVTRVVLDGNVYFSGREVLSAVSNIVHHGEAFLSKCKRMGIKHVLGPPAVLKALGNGRECAKHLTSYDCRVFKTVDEESLTKLVQQLVEKPSTVGLSEVFPTHEDLNSRSGTNEGMHPTSNNVRQPSGPPSASYNENNKAKSLLQDAAPAQSNNDARAFCREEVAPEVTRTSRHAGTFWLGNPTKKELNKSDRALKYKYGIGKFSSTLQCIVENERKYCYLNDVHYVAPHRSKEDIVSVCHALGLQASLEKVEVPSIATLLQILKILMGLPDDQSTTAREQNIAEKEDQLHECQPVGAQVLQSKVNSDRNMSEVDQRQHSKGGIFSVPMTHSKVPWLFHLQLDMVTVDDVENAIPAASLDNVQQYMMPPWGPEVLNMYAATAGLSQVYNSKQKLVSLRSLVPKPRDTGVVQDCDQTDKLNKSAQLSDGSGGTSSPTRHSEALPLHASQTVEQSGENIGRPGEGGPGSILRALLSDHSYSVQKSDQETGSPTTAQNNIEVCRHTPAHITREVNGLDEGDDHADTEHVTLTGEGKQILDNPTAPVGGNQGENMQCHVAESNDTTGVPASPSVNGTAAQEEARDTNPGDCGSYVTGIEADQETGSPTTAQNIVTTAQKTHEINGVDDEDHADTGVSLSSEGKEMLDNPTAPVDGNQGECMQPTDNNRKWPSDHGDIAEASTAKRQCTANTSESPKCTSNSIGVCLSDEPTSARPSQDNVGPTQRESGVHTKDCDVAESNANTGVPASPTVNDTAAQEEVRDTNPGDRASYVTGIETETTTYFEGLPVETKVNVNTIDTNGDQETGSPSTAQNNIEVCRRTIAQVTHEVNGLDEEDHADTEGVSLSGEGKEMLDNPTAPVDGNQGECMQPTDNKRKLPSDHGDIAEASTAKRQCTANTGESTRRTSNGLEVCLTDEPTSARPSQDNVKQESGLHTKDCYVVASNATNGDVTWNDYIRIYRAWSEAVDGPASPPQPLVREKEQLKYELKWETLTESAVPIPVVEKDGSRYVLTSDVSSLVRGVDAGDFMDALGMLELSIVPCSPEISECFTSQAGKPREQCRNMVKLHMTLGATVKMLLIIVKDKRQQTTVRSNCGQHPDKSQSFAGKSISAGCTSVSHPIQRPPPARCLPATLWNRKTTSHCPSTVENSQPVATPESTSPVEALHRSSHMPQGSRSAENVESGGIRGFQTRQQSTQKLYNPVLPNMPEPRQSQSRSLTLSPELNAHFAPPLPRGDRLSAANPFDQQHRSFYATQKRAISNFQGMTAVSSSPTYQQRLVQSRSPTERAQVPSGSHNYPATMSNRTYVPSQAHAQPGCSLHVSHSVPGQAFMPLVPMESRANPPSHQYHSQPVPRHHLQISYSLSPNGPPVQPASPSHTTSWDRRPTPVSTALRQYGAQHHDVPSAACSRNTDNPAPRRLP